MNPTLCILATGGTFDKEYDEIQGRLFFKNTHVSEMLSLGRSSVAVDVQTLMMIDSLDMKPQDRDMILGHCQRSKYSRIVITHGTDTMAETAQVLGNAISTLVGKTIVLTGAMVPYKFGSSDGLFNLGAAVAFAQSLNPGVYVAMNGRFLNWDNVRKNKSTGLFESLA